MAVEQKIDEQNDQFPVGMRVLAVDDDPTCLMVLETLLRKCKYHVTTTSEAITALKMLRENKNMFDLVISDVHMPDMDGFRLLELVGLEMDLPVIMLSAYGDTKLVMKGITHGACDYLLKPVRIEELKNIWQHVIRRKKCDSKEQKFVDKLHGGCGERGEGLMAMGDCDQNGKLNRKRKDQNVDDEEENEENGYDSEDPSTQKKPRVVWSVELHQKFVGAVNQLGIDKAVPKRILELMNVEKLTRENVASHLQKYRLYLKRISCVTTQQANMVAAFGNASSAYMRMGSLNGLGNFLTVVGSGQFQNSALRSFPSGSVLGRLNTPAGLGMHGLSPSGIKPLGVAQNMSKPVNDLANYPPVQSGNQNRHILQGIPMSLELDQMQHNKSVAQTGEFATSTNDSLVYPISSGFSDMKININNSRSSLLGTPNDSITLLGHRQGNQCQRGFGDESSVTDISVQKIPSHLSDSDRCTDNWASVFQSSGFKSDSYSGSNCFKQNNTSELRNNVSPMAVNTVTNLQDVSSLSSPSPQLLDMRTDFKTQATSISSDSVQYMSSIPKQGWDDNSQNIDFHSNFICSSMNSSVFPHSSVGPFYQRLDPKNLNCQIGDDFNSIGQRNCTNPLADVVENTTMRMGLKLKQGYVGEQMKEHGSYADNNPGSFENILSALMKQEQDSLIKAADLGCDAYSHYHGTSI